MKIIKTVMVGGPGHGRVFELVESEQEMTLVEAQPNSPLMSAQGIQFRDKPYAEHKYRLRNFKTDKDFGSQRTYPVLVHRDLIHSETNATLALVVLDAMMRAFL